jgi:hypothetical protein
MSEFLKRWALPTLRLIGLDRGFGAAFGFDGGVFDQLVGVGLIQREQKRDVFHVNTVGRLASRPYEHGANCGSGFCDRFNFRSGILSVTQLFNFSINGRHFVGWALPTIASKTTYGSMSEFLKRWALPTLRLIGLDRGFGAAFGFDGGVLYQLVGVGLVKRK